MEIVKSLAQQKQVKSTSTFKLDLNSSPPVFLAVF